MSKKKSMVILSTETSCDETALALVKFKLNPPTAIASSKLISKDTQHPQKDRDILSDTVWRADPKIEILSNLVSSQTKLHAQWGGVVPNLAAREHLKNILPLLEKVFKKNNLTPQDIDLLAVTQGPGLIPALLVGTTTAKTLAYLWQKPLLGIHHIEGQIYANFIQNIGETPQRDVSTKKHIKLKSSLFPILCLVVSGGHTQLILMKKHLDYKIIGETLDDAAGEAFDKVARILELGYPGGPEIAKLAKTKLSENKDNLNKKTSSTITSEINLPRPMINKPDFNFSFSGLKTAVLYKAAGFKKQKKFNKNNKILIAQDFQQAVCDVLIKKTLKASAKYKPKTVMLAGGVSANEELRQQLGNKLKKEFPNISYVIPEIKYSIDNAAMIAVAAFYRWQFMNRSQKEKSLKNWKTLQAEANLKLK